MNKHIKHGSVFSLRITFLDHPFSFGFVKLNKHVSKANLHILCKQKQEH